MLTKAYVEEIVDNYRVKVRIPIFNGLDSSPNATPTEQLSISPICAIPGGKYNYSVGDIVFVTFEDNDLGRPVILGQLYADIDNQGLASLTLDSLEVKQSATLPQDTSIGNVSAEAIKNLQGIRLPVQQQIDSLSGVASVAQNIPYMNTIQQAFMEAHYVLLPNGDYIVDSFVANQNPYKSGGSHYFYEFAENILTEEEEIPIYNQNRILYKIQLGQNTWNPSSISGQDNLSPVYVVFSISSQEQTASLYTITDIAGVQNNRSMFRQIEGTRISIEVGDYLQQDVGDNIHGDKYFWEILISNFSTGYKFGDYPETSSSVVGEHTFTHLKKIGDSTTADQYVLQYPCIFYDVQDEGYQAYFSNLCWGYTRGVPVGDVFVSFLDEDGNPLKRVNADDETVLYFHPAYETTNGLWYVDVPYSYADGQTQHTNSPPHTVIINTSEPDDNTVGSGQVIVFEFSSSYGPDEEIAFGSPSPHSIRLIPGQKEVGFNSILYSFISSTFGSISRLSSFSMVNVLQLVGVMAFSISGTSLSYISSQISSPRTEFDLGVMYVPGQSQLEGYGSVLDVLPGMFKTLYGTEYQGGISQVGDILYGVAAVHDSYTYEWNGWGNPPQGNSEVLWRTLR